jgi:hypothetical protein
MLPLIADKNKTQKPKNIKDNKSSKVPPIAASNTGNPDNCNNSDNQTRHNQGRPKKGIEPIVIFTGMLVVVGVIQSFILWETVISQRAFVSISTFEAIPYTNIFTIKVTWENSGATPTQNMLSHINYQVFTDKQSLDSFTFTDFDQSGNPVKDHKGNLPLYMTAKSTQSFRLNIDPKYFDAIRTRKAVLLIYGWASYKDIYPFTKRHIVKFCRKLDVDTVADNSGNILQYKFSTSNWDKYNCSDEDCR